MLAMEDTGALLRFVQRSNDVDLREGELTLRTQGRYSELVALYQQRGQHEAALNLLHTLTLSPQDLPTPPSGNPPLQSCTILLWPLHSFSVISGLGISLSSVFLADRRSC